MSAPRTAPAPEEVAARDDVQRASDKLLEAVRRMHVGTGWMTAAEIGGISAASFTAMAKRSPPWIERRHTRWGGETGQRSGRGYEYRLTDHGTLVRAIADEENGTC